jgi:Hint module
VNFQKLYEVAMGIPVPTNAPSRKPSCAPTRSPTAAPTYVQTAVPTAAPVTVTVIQPTGAPTVTPTTSTPTNTYAPTASPTAAPSITLSPTDSQITVVAVAQSVQGVSVAAAQEQKFQDSFIDGVAVALMIDRKNVQITNIAPASSRRRIRLLLASGGGGVLISYTVTAAGVSSAAISTQLQSSSAANTIQQALTGAGYSDVTVSAAPTVVDLSSTPSPTSRPVAQPASAPTAPQVTAADSPVTKGGSCFSAQDTCLLQDGTVKLIPDVRVGDRILAADEYGNLQYSEVIAVPHNRNSVQATFVKLVTSTGRDIHMTPYHIIPVGNCPVPLMMSSTSSTSATTTTEDPITLPLDSAYIRMRTYAHSEAPEEGQTNPRLASDLTFAKDITIGSCVHTVLGLEEVVDVKLISMEGVYTVVTREEFVVVNGMVASPFAISHTFAHLLYNVHRTIAYSFQLKRIVALFEDALDWGLGQVTAL